MISVTRTFNPRGIKPEEYMMTYEELGKMDETRKMKGVELMWCWYYGCKDSPFVSGGYSHIDKCMNVTALVFDNLFSGRFYEEKTIASLRAGEIPNTWSAAIDFFRKIDTDSRQKSKNMIDTMFDQYTTIVNGGVEQFKDKNGDVDYAKYVTTMNRIRDELPSLIKQKESGFGVTDTFVDADSELSEGSYYNEMYLKSKS